MLKYLQQIGYLEILINMHEFQGRKEKRKKEKKNSSSKNLSKKTKHMLSEEKEDTTRNLKT